MDTLKALLERRTVHKYSTDPVPDAVVQTALQAAHHAPNHKLTFPWRFTVVGRETRRELSQIAGRLKGADTDAKMDSVRAKMENPGLLVVVSQVLTADTFRAREDYAAISCAIQNLMLSLWDSGFGSKWSTGGPTRDPATYQLLQIDPEREEIVGFVWGGKPAVEPTAPKRPPLSDHVRRLS